MPTQPLEGTVTTTDVVSMTEENHDNDKEGTEEADDITANSEEDTRINKSCMIPPLPEPAIGGMHPAICSGDLGKVVQLKAQRSLTENEKFFLLKHHFVPPKNYNFPSRVFGDRQRHFQNTWLEKYNGLVYSESEDGGYCKFCVLFARCEPSVKELGILVNKPLTNFKKAVEKLSEHFTSKGRKSHQSALETAMAFTAVMESRAVSDVLLKTA
jgi:hypothetical protein